MHILIHQPDATGLAQIQTLSIITPILSSCEINAANKNKLLQLLFPSLANNEFALIIKGVEYK